MSEPAPETTDPQTPPAGDNAPPQVDPAPETTDPATPPAGDNAPPQVDPITPPDAPTDTPDENQATDAAAGEPTGRRVDASEDPNLGHAFEDQAQGVGIGPTQTTEQIDQAAAERDDVERAI